MKKRIAFDMFLNIVATAIPIFVLQIIILPLLSRNVSDERYGLLVTVLAILNVVPATLGNALNNVRLVESEDDSENNTLGYNAILLQLAFLNLIIVAVFSYYYEKHITVVSMLLTLLVSILWLFREYFIVAFRIKLNFVYIVLCNVIMVLGYTIGFFLFKATTHWQLIYILGLVFSLGFIFAKSKLWREPIIWKKETLYIGKQTIALALAGFLSRVTTYADKLLIFPILGGAVVSVYYTATLFGKIISLVITPVSGVVLSYLSKEKRKDDHIFGYAFFSGLILCVIGYFICVSISRPILQILYPQFVNAAMHYIWITTATTVITALISIVNPFVLKFFDMKWQLVINLIYVVFYVCVAMLMLNRWGLLGFCVGALLSSIVKIVTMVIIYKRSSEKVKIV